MTLPVLIEQILVQMSGIPADFLGANEIITNLPSSMWLPQNFLMTIFNLIRLLCPAIQLWENLSTNRLSWITCTQVWKKAPSLNTVAVFIVDFSLTRHFNSLRSKLPYNTHLSSDIDEFSAS